MLSSHFIVNPFSAAGRTARVWAQMEPTVRAIFPGAHFHMTEASGHASKLAREAALAGADLVVSVGGDGTNNEVLNGLFANEKAIHPELRFASLPMGTGGDLIRSISIARDPMEALLQIQAGRFISADVGCLKFKSFAGQVREHYFLNVASFGMSGLTVRLVNESSKWMGGRLSFLKGVLKAVVQYQRAEVNVVAAGETLYAGKIVAGVVANGGYFGGGMHIAPNAQMNDGTFDFVLIGDINRRGLFWNLSKLYDGRHTKLERVKTFKANTLEATSPQDVLLDIDGESLGTLPCEFRCLAAALRLTVGSECGAHYSSSMV